MMPFCALHTDCPNPRKRSFRLGKHLDIYLYLLFLCELLIGSYDLGHTGLQHLLQGHLGQGMASNPINFLAQAKQEGLYIPGWLKDNKHIAKCTQQAPHGPHLGYLDLSNQASAH